MKSSFVAIVLHVLYDYYSNKKTHHQFTHFGKVLNDKGRKMKKQPEVTEATRKDFICAFCEYYLERPIEKITVKEIAEKAGYSRVTFYNYFKDPYDLLTYIEEEYISCIMKEISCNVEQNKILDNFLYTFDKLINENELYSQVLLNNPHSLQFINRLKERLIPLVMKSFGISPDNKKALYAFEFYMPGVIAVLSRWMQNRRDIPIEELAKIIKGILQEGLLSQLNYC